MNSSNIKTTLLLVGILPTLLASLSQIGYLSFRHYSSDSLPLTSNGRLITQLNSSPSQVNTLEPGSSQYRPLIIASSLIGLSSILLAGFMAIYFSRRTASYQETMQTQPESNNITDTAKAIDSKTVHTDYTPSPQTLATLSPTRSTPLQSTNASNFSVLIADDNKINRLLLANQLEGQCQKITLAKEGIEALQYLTSELFDLILLDLQMPGHSGHELIKIIRKDYCINKDTPVIAITAHAHVSQRKKIIAEGFDECLIKPILAEQLEEVLYLWHPSVDLPPLADKSYYCRQILDKTHQNQELALIIAKKLFTEMPQQLSHIEIALTQQQLKRAQETVHQLHGSASFCGLADIQKSAHALEQSLLNNNTAHANAHFSELLEAAQKFIATERFTLAELSKPND